MVQKKRKRSDLQQPGSNNSDTNTNKSGYTPAKKRNACHTKSTSSIDEAKDIETRGRKHDQTAKENGLKRNPGKKAILPSSTSRSLSNVNVDDEGEGDDKGDDNVIIGIKARMNMPQLSEKTSTSSACRRNIRSNTKSMIKRDSQASTSSTSSRTIGSQLPPPPSARIASASSASELASVVSTSSAKTIHSEEEEEEDDNDDIENVTKETGARRKKSSIFGRILSLLLIATFITLIILTLLDKHLDELEELDTRLNSQLVNKNIELEETQKMYNVSQNTLKSTSKQLETLQSSEKRCNQANTIIQQQVDELLKNSTTLSGELIETRKKLSSIVGSEEDVRHSLYEAWEQLDSLAEEKNGLNELHTTCELSASRLVDEVEDSQNRILELEFSLVDEEHKYKSLQSNYEEEKSIRSKVESRLSETLDTVDTLEDQLDTEDGRAWYYQLQIKHLEESIDEQEKSMEDLKNWNNKLKEEKLALKEALRSQADEAIYALNAVASSATLRKAEQLQERDKVFQIEMENQMLEALNAVNAVAAVNKAQSEDDKKK